MAVNNLDFGATVDAWCKKSEARMEAVFRGSTQSVYSIVLDNLSGTLVGVITGFLRASAVPVVNGPVPPIDPNANPAAGGSYAPSSEIATTIASAQLGDQIAIGWTASYAGHVHDGTSKTGPRPFVTLAAMQWPQIVSREVEKAKAAAGQSSAPAAQ